MYSKYVSQTIVYWCYPLYTVELDNEHNGMNNILYERNVNLYAQSHYILSMDRYS